MRESPRVLSAGGWRWLLFFFFFLEMASIIKQHIPRSQQVKVNGWQRSSRDHVVAESKGTRDAGSWLWALPLPLTASAAFSTPSLIYPVGLMMACALKAAQ